MIVTAAYVGPPYPATSPIDLPVAPSPPLGDASSGLSSGLTILGVLAVGAIALTIMARGKKRR